MHLKNIGILIPIALTLISRGFDWQEVIISSLQLVTYRKQSANNDPFHWCDIIHHRSAMIQTDFPQILAVLISTL